MRTGQNSPDWPHPMGVFTGLGETAQKGAVGLHLRLVLHLLLGCGLQQSGLKASRHRYQWTQQLFTIRSRHGGFTGFAGQFVVRAQLILGQHADVHSISAAYSRG